MREISNLAPSGTRRDARKQLEVLVVAKGKRPRRSSLSCDSRDAALFDEREELERRT
jgi:hypothetical protein